MPKNEILFKHASAGPSHKPNVITYELRTAYEQTLLEKEQIIREIARVRGELSTGHLVMEQLRAEEQKAIAEVAARPPRAPPTPLPATPAPQTPTPTNTSREDLSVKKPPPAVSEEEPKPRKGVKLPPDQTLPHSKDHDVPPPPPPPTPLTKAPTTMADKQVQVTTLAEPVVVAVGEKMDDVEEAVVVVDEVGVAREDVVIEQTSETSLKVRRQLHQEIAAMHLAIQERVCIASAFIMLLLVLLIFF